MVIVQNDVGNRHSPTVIAAAITSRQDKSPMPTHIRIRGDSCGLAKDSVVLLEQIRTIDKARLREKTGRREDNDLQKVNRRLNISFGLDGTY